MTGRADRADLLASLHPITRALRRIEEAAAAGDELSMWQYAILSVVADRPGGNQREIAAYLQYSANRIVADLDDLERRGWLTRRAAADRRANVLEITDAGEDVRGRVQAEIHRREDALLDGLTAAERACFDRAARLVARRVRSARLRDEPVRPPRRG